MIKTLNRAWEAVSRFLPEVILGLFCLTALPLLFVVGRSAVRQVIQLADDPAAYGRSLSQMPWAVAAAAVFVAGLAALAYIIWRNWSPIWAVGRKMIREAINRKTVLVLLIFVAVLMPSLPFVLKTEGRLSSQVQLVLLYSLSLALVLLSLLAIFLTTASICSEVENRHVYLTDPKPLLRWQFLMGKWVGTVVLCTVVLVVMASGTYGLVTYMAREPDYARMSPQDAARARKAQVELRQRVFTARKVIQAPLPDVSEKVDAAIQKKFEETDYGFSPYELRRALVKDYRTKALTAQPGGGKLLWRFTGLDPDRPEPIQVRFKAFNYGSGAIQWPCRFTPYQGKKVEPEKEGERPRLVLSRSGNMVRPPTSGWASHTFHQFDLPAGTIGADGTLYLVFQNPGLESIVFDVENPVEVLQKEGNFFLNYYRSVAVLVFQIALLAALGLMAGSLFSFPVASLLVFCLFVGGLLGSWYHGQFIEPGRMVFIPSSTVYYLDQVWRGFASTILALMPSFSTFSPLSSVVNGRMVTASDVTVAGAVVLVLKTGGAMLIGMYFYARKELARIVV